MIKIPRMETVQEDPAVGMTSIMQVKLQLLQGLTHYLLILTETAFRLLLSMTDI